MIVAVCVLYSTSSPDVGSVRSCEPLVSVAVSHKAAACTLLSTTAAFLEPDVWSITTGGSTFALQEHAIGFCKRLAQNEKGLMLVLYSPHFQNLFQDLL